MIFLLNNRKKVCGSQCCWLRSTTEQITGLNDPAPNLFEMGLGLSSNFGQMGEKLSAIKFAFAEWSNGNGLAAMEELSDKLNSENLGAQNAETCSMVVRLNLQEQSPYLN